MIGNEDGASLLPAAERQAKSAKRAETWLTVRACAKAIGHRHHE